MREGVQTQLIAMGESACFFLSICKIIEEVNCRNVNITDTFDACVEHKLISFNYQSPYDNENCYVLDAVRILSLLTGKTWNFRKIQNPEEIQNWKAGDNEYTIQRWVRKVTGKEITHFRRPTWDPLLKSQTVRYGCIDALYIFTLLE